MKTVILAGGSGSMIATEREIRPKTLIEVGNRPLLWHIMMQFSSYGFDQFLVALGYKGNMVKRYMLDYSTLDQDMTIHTGNGAAHYVEAERPDWTVKLIDTGVNTKTAGRLKRLAGHIHDTFLLTWGDTVSNIDLHALIDKHKSHNKLATMAIVRPVARYGHIVFDGDRVAEFNEKPQTAEGWVNSGVYVLEPEAINFIDSDDEMWAHEPLQRLAAAGELKSYEHNSFWHACDTLRDRHILQTLWETGEKPWAVWEQPSAAGPASPHFFRHVR